MNDRGIIEPGKRADIYIIDLDSLKIGDPKMVFDLPAEQPRYLADAEGYIGTYVKGELIQANGELADARPGAVIRPN